MSKPFLYEHQALAISNMKNGCILNGGVGSGKSRASLYYYFQLEGGSIEDEYKPMKKKPKDLYIITTARKRDLLDWEGELAPFLMSSLQDRKEKYYDHNVVVDSWNNIKKYKDVKNAFFIFDEQRVVGSGTWVKNFLKITKGNDWILLSATPGDTWSDYIPVFIANGYYKNKTEFNREHCVYSRYTKYPKIEKYINTKRLQRQKAELLINMDFSRTTVRNHIDILTEFNRPLYKDTMKNRWNPFTNAPIEQASELCYTLRRIVNASESRIVSLLEVLDKIDRAIIFYNFDYERDLLLELFKRSNYDVTEWNGHKHEDVPKSKKWLYLVQYAAGAEGWNCITTNSVIFYSQSYSYKMTEQACGRVDRLNTLYKDLYYYHLKSNSSIDLAISRALKDKKNFNENKFVSFK